MYTEFEVGIDLNIHLTKQPVDFRPVDRSVPVSLTFICALK